MRDNGALKLAGRLLTALIFLASAVGKLANFDGTVQYMEAHGLPAASFLCVCAAALEALGGAALALGWRTRAAAGLLAAFLLAATAAFHLAPDQRVQLLKNLAILGGLLYVMASGAGPISLDAREGR